MQKGLPLNTWSGGERLSGRGAMLQPGYERVDKGEENISERGTSMWESTEWGRTGLHLRTEGVYLPGLQVGKERKMKGFGGDVKKSGLYPQLDLKQEVTWLNWHFGWKITLVTHLKKGWVGDCSAVVVQASGWGSFSEGRTKGTDRRDQL